MRSLNESALAFAAVSLGSVLAAKSVDSAEPPRLSPAELKAIYAAIKLKPRNGTLFDECDQPVKPEIEVMDLNGDGQPEVFVFAGGTCYGATGGKLWLLIRDKSRRWKANFGFPAGGYRILATKSKGYPDIEIGGPGLCLPVWRWTGTKYDIHEGCDRYGAPLQTPESGRR